LSPKNFSWLARLSRRHLDFEQPPGLDFEEARVGRDQLGDAPVAGRGQHRDRVRGPVRAGHDALPDERPDDPPGRSADLVEEVLDDRHQAFRRTPPEDVLESLRDTWLDRHPSRRMSLTGRTP
jgi:hypothetical protein